jgi:hypothetical protein
MTNNKQETIEEAAERILSKEGVKLHPSGLETYLKGNVINAMVEMVKWFEQAKEMDKERMIGFTNKYINSELWVNCNAIESDSTVEQYYEQTYGGGNK